MFKEQQHQEYIVQQIQKELNELQKDQQSLPKRQQQYLKEINDIIANLKSEQSRTDKSISKLHKLKNELHSELLTEMPFIGLMHQKVLGKESVNQKILRMKEQQEARIEQDQILKSAAELHAQQAIKGNNQKTIEDQESLALSQSYNPSTNKKSKNYQEQGLGNVPQIQVSKPAEDQRKNKPKQSGFDYGAYDDEDY